MATAILFAGSAWIGTGPIDDLDSYWHVEIGREIVARHAVEGLGLAWLGVPTEPWRTSQWLSEVGMYAAVDRFGWTALPALRLLAIGALFTILTLTLLRRRQPIAGFVVVLATVIGLQILLQDRPATLSLLFIALLGPACERLWTTGRRPPPVAVAAACVLWAQLHGLWVLAPAAFALVAVGALLDRRHAPAGQLRGALVSGAASLAGVINPQGLESFLLPLRFRDAAGTRITEWFPTAFTNSLSISWGILVLLLIFAWVRSPVRVPTTEVLWTAVWTVFAVGAIRNVGPVVLLTAPVVLRALERAFGPRLEQMSARPSPAMARVLGVTLVAVCLTAVTVVSATLVRMDPLRDTPALAIARRLADVPRPVRVWNAYNIAGSLIAFSGGREGRVRLVVDGRSDLWGSRYIERLIDVQSGLPGWQAEFDRFRADVVVLPSGTPLASYLIEVRRWRVAVTDQDYLLLLPPESTLLLR